MIPLDRITKANMGIYPAGKTAFVSGSNLHPNPRMYKYYWWIYSELSEFESAEEVFFKEQYSLSTKEAFALMDELQAKKIRFVTANTKRKRLGSIWDYPRILQEYPDEIFAPSYEDDPTPDWNGHK